MSLGTGHKGTLTFGTSALSLAFRSIGGATRERPEIATSDLSTTDWESFIPGDLVNPGSTDVEYLVDVEDSDAVPDITDPSESIVVTYPITNSSNNTNATLTRTGFFTSVTEPSLVTDELMMGTATIKWSGAPTWSAETTV